MNVPVKNEIQLFEDQKIRVAWDAAREEWVHQRLLAIRTRNELTDEWRKHGVQKGREYAILTDEITRAWSGMSNRQYKNLKGLKKYNLCDNMSDLELVTDIVVDTAALPERNKEKDKNESRYRQSRRDSAVQR